MNDNLINIINIIEKYNLKSKSRKQKYVYPRYYLYSVLHYEMGYGWSAIGRIFNKDHATIMNGLKQHELYTKQKDATYFYFLIDVKSELVITEYRPSLKEEILKCKNILELDIIKRKITENFYYL